MTIQQNAEKAAERLQELFPTIQGIHVENAKIHLGNAAEGGLINEEPAADYYGYTRTYPWINQQLVEAVEEMGWRIEWHDPGTLFAYWE